MEEELTEIEQDLAIDKDRLDFECIDQPRKFMKWSVKHAQAVKDRDEAKRLCAVTRSTTALNIRSDPGTYGIEKATEASIAAALEEQPEVKREEQGLVDTIYNLNIYSAAREAMEQRRNMIESLTRLYVAGYWSQPHLKPEDLATFSDDTSEKMKEALSQNPRLLARKKS